MNYSYFNSSDDKPPGDNVTVSQPRWIAYLTVVLLVVMLVSVIGCTVLCFCINTYEMKIITVVVVAVCGAFVFLLKGLAKVSFKEQIKFLSDYYSGESKSDFPKPKVISCIITILSILVIISAVGCEAAISVASITPTKPQKAVTSSPTEPSTESTAPSGLTFYDLADETDCDEYYFYKTTSGKELAYSLFYSVGFIKSETPVSNKELNVSKEYGGKAEIALKHTKLLNEVLENSDDVILNGPIPKNIYDYIIKTRIAMDSVYATPENRAVISQLYVYGAEKRLETDIIASYKRALLYMWKSFVVRRSWGEYRKKDLEEIKLIYEKLIDVDKENSNHLQMVIDALEIFECRMESSETATEPSE